MVATLDELDEAALVKILTEPKNAVTKQFKKLFEMEDVELEFRPEALQAIARKALKRKTGARGLRTILEQVLLDTMYELPSLEHVSKVVVDDAVIEGQAEPYLIYRGNLQQRVASRGQRRRLTRSSCDASDDGSGDFTGAVLLLRASWTLHGRTGCLHLT